MYHISNNPSSIQSKEDISNALISLLSDNNYNDVNISKICKKAYISRQTFYRNFDEKNDILRYILNGIGITFVKNYSMDKINIPSIISEYYKFLLNYKNILIIIINNNLEFLLKENIFNMFTSFDLSNYEIYNNNPNIEYIFDFVVSTLVSVLSLWTKHNFKETPDVISDITLKFFDGIL